MRSLLKLFFPDQCQACDALLSRGEHLLCTDCRHNLPVNLLHHTTYNPIKKVLYGRVSLELATSLFYFDKKSRVQQLIHNLKYRNQEQISAFLGDWLGAELAQVVAYQNIDVVVPVPLHANRLKERGYNQVAGFGQRIATALQIDYNDRVLYRKKATKTQVFSNRGGRSTEVIDSFGITEDQSLKNKHILLVDDLITTGGTLEGCALALNRIEGIKISVAVMAIAN